jgi:flagellar biosynthesis/type III secretory pathway M-ring protein FliF/YscJ
MAGIFAWFGGAWNWFMGSPVAQIGAAIIAFVFAWEFTKKRLKDEGAKEQKRIHETAAAKEQAEVAHTQQQITQERNDDRERADAAVEALPRFDGPEQLRKQRPDLHAILFGNAEAGGS